MVLNSLAGPGLKRSFEILAPCGRFVELGKQDIVENRALDMLPFNRSVTFSAIDLDRMAIDRPEYFAPLVRTVMQAFTDGELTPLPMKVLPADQVEDAFRLMASGALIGKAVVTLHGAKVNVATGLKAGTLFHADRSYLITGGTRGFGLQTARWMVEQGAGEVTLASRSGEVSGADRPIIDAMLACGARVHFAKLDVGDAQAVADCVKAFGKDKPELAGVFHSAMVLDDVALNLQSQERFARVMKPKAGGAWNLHLATKHLLLDHFVLFSSVSALVGNPSQSSYAGSLNSFLDAAGLPSHQARASCCR